MSCSICIRQTGGPEVLQWEEVSIDAPGPGEVKAERADLLAGATALFDGAGRVDSCGVGNESSGSVSRSWIWIT